MRTKIKIPGIGNMTSIVKFEGFILRTRQNLLFDVVEIQELLPILLLFVRTSRTGLRILNFDTTFFARLRTNLEKCDDWE